MFKHVAAAAALAMAAPAFAQTELPTDCISATDTALASDMVNEFLADSGFGERPAPFSERLGKAAGDCANANNVPEAKAESFVAANLAVMMAEEIQARLVATGFDMAPVAALLEQLALQPSLDIAEYIDARPSEFAGPATQAAAQAGIAQGEVLALIGGYVGMRMLQSDMSKALSAP